MAKTNRQYWLERAQHRELISYTGGLDVVAYLLKQYKKAATSIRKEINDFYQRYASENGLTYADAMREMSRSELREWRGSVEDYIRRIQNEPNPQVRERLMREYDALAYNSRISRLDGLCGNIQMNVDSLYARAQEQLSSFLGETYTGGYYRAMYDLQTRLGYNGQFSTISAEMVEKTLAYPWSGANFSDRLWRNKAALIDTIRDTLTQGMIRGDNIRDMSKAVADKLNSSYRNAERLVRTETSHIHNTAEVAAYEAAGYEEYEFMASFGEKTCEVCGGLDGQHFKLTDIQYGVNFPPVHPNCRCTTVGWDEVDEDEKLLEGQKQLTYEEWKKLYVDDRVEIELPKQPEPPAPVIPAAQNATVQTLTTGANGGIISSRVFNPIPQSQVVNILRRDSDEWINQLSNEELRAIQKYTKNSGDTTRPFFYERLNAMLRGAIPEDSRLRYYADTISSALNKNTLKHDILCYRRDSTDIFAGLSEGDEFIINSFFSTSATPKGALNKGILCKIHIPEGAVGAYIEKLSSFPNQREFLLDKGQKYRVLSRSDNVIELEVVINEQYKN